MRTVAAKLGDSAPRLDDVLKRVAVFLYAPLFPTRSRSLGALVPYALSFPTRFRSLRAFVPYAPPFPTRPRSLRAFVPYDSGAEDFR